MSLPFWERRLSFYSPLAHNLVGAQVDKQRTLLVAQEAVPQTWIRSLLDRFAAY